MTRKAFKPKLVVITGGGSGIGAAMAKALVARGSRVIVVDINLDHAVKTQQALGNLCKAVQLNVCDEKQVKIFFENLLLKSEVPDCLINCAGVNQHAEALDVSISDWMHVLTVNLIGTALMSLAAYKIMAGQKYGTIINMGSMATFLVDPMFNAYITSKFGVVGFSRSLAVEAAAYGVGVHVVCPGNITTPMRDERYQLSWFTPTMPVDDAVNKILLGVEKKSGIIVFPFHTRVYWWLDRLNPNFFAPVRREIFKRARFRNENAKS